MDRCAEGDQLGANVIEIMLRARADGHAAAAARQLESDSATEPSRRAADERGLAVESHSPRCTDERRERRSDAQYSSGSLHHRGQHGLSFDGITGEE